MRPNKLYNMRYLLIIFIFFAGCLASAAEYKYILNEKCINNLYDAAEKAINNKNIHIIKDSRGIILRFSLDNPLKEVESLSGETVQNLKDVGFFLAKTKNLVIMEVHAGDIKPDFDIKYKNWEISSVIAGKTEDEVLKTLSSGDYSRVKSVGFGEFMPIKNTPYNGGNYSNRVDIIVLCNVSGE